MKRHTIIIFLFLCSFVTFFISCESLQKIIIEDAESDAAAERYVKGPNYIWDESRNPAGPHRCSNSYQCTSTRTCGRFGWCQN